jgi:ABC-type sugar transport system permease subunit
MSQTQIVQATAAIEQGVSAPQTRQTSFGTTRKTARRSFRRHWQLYLVLLPGLLYFVVFKYVPMINAVIAFKDYNVVAGIWGSPWVGFKHFAIVLQQSGLLDIAPKYAGSQPLCPDRSVFRSQSCWPLA